MNRRYAGKQAESLACSYLESKGYRILERNYHTPYGEIDIVCAKDDLIVFVEVRSTNVGWDVENSIDSRKLERMMNSALFYISENGKELNLRFDLIVVKKGKVEMHLQGISFNSDVGF